MAKTAMKRWFAWVTSKLIFGTGIHYCAICGGTSMSCDCNKETLVMGLEINCHTFSPDSN